MGIHSQQFTTRFLQAKIRLAYLHPHEVVEAVINDEADLGILSFPIPHRSLTIVPWHFEPMVFVCNRYHTLAKRRNVCFRVLESETFVECGRCHSNMNRVE